MTIVLAVDIGKTGAIAAVDSRGTATIEDLPLAEQFGEQVIDARALILLVRQLVPATEGCMAVIERLRPRPMGNGGLRGNTMHSQGDLMQSAGIVRAVLTIARMDARAVEPQTWKRHFGLLRKDKDESRAMALRLYPTLADRLARKKDHNRADALLLAHYGMTTLVDDVDARRAA